MSNDSQLSDNNKEIGNSEEVEAVEGDGQVTSNGESLSNDELLLALEEANARAEENWNQVLRAKAELENYRRRAQQDVEKARKFGLEKISNELLPVKDSLELGLTATENDVNDIEKLREGMELTLKLLTEAMEKVGIREVNPVNEKFDPEFHQAMSIQETGDVDPNTVVTVFQKGYLLNERLIRPAMVVVAKAQDEKNQENSNKIDQMA
ncbi:MAG: nucleotide exchange factor GrpE [Gammaproteobacteria bacterium]